ncbi:Uncharacterized protein Adt_17542 [Abeliophyllum distichum]|uniref:Uncharacterized protein n=1 Tax=Abeliophyllum distichum TaxID=126358 RepID=A0ABD1TGU7_9LAMI
MFRRGGPCFHCGFTHYSAWRAEPLQKSRLGKRKIVVDYAPRREYNVAQSSQVGNLPSGENHAIPVPGNLPSAVNPAIRVHRIFGSEVNPVIPVTVSGNQEPKLESEFAFSAGVQNDMYHGSSSETLSSIFEDDIQMQATNGKKDYIQMQDTDEADEPSLWDPSYVPRRKRSKLQQHTSSVLTRFTMQLHYISQDPEFNNQSEGEPDDMLYDDVLIYQKNKYIPENEIGIGAMLPPLLASPMKDSKLDSSAIGNSASCLIVCPIQSSSQSMCRKRYISIFLFA